MTCTPVDVSTPLLVAVTVYLMVSPGSGCVSSTAFVTAMSAAWICDSRTKDDNNTKSFPDDIRS
ncbi:hypothetical protein BMS3Bbin02_01201 [bacterium BMS3Bbin02]|nr:hypothetical protein BMS3Bbin02_01201 [bacterium BMS3Bbin02]